ncbi:MAG: hypothetical protein IT285_01820 [Bdellovibrionales bacterium]|nr:hypothetical protein [Bdellovibrionales bacterium]
MPARRRPAKKSPHPRSRVKAPAATPAPAVPRKPWTSPRGPEFPLPDGLWRRFFDDAAPYYVKKTYLPGRLWRDGSFSQADAAFFRDGIQDLPRAFTGAAGPKPGYFSSERYRSSYLLYWLPFQAAKFTRLFAIHPPAIARAWERATAPGGSGELVCVDLGAGPGTASFAWLTWLKHAFNWPRAAGSPRVRLEWVDQDRDILNDGKALLETFLKTHEIPGDRVTLNLHSKPLQLATAGIEGGDGIILAGNVFNEFPTGRRFDTRWLLELQAKMRGGGMLILEPAHDTTARTLAGLRADFLDSGLWKEPRSRAIWGPCMHAEACPMAEGKDWCHFSAPAGVPGRWFKFFSEYLGSERQWLKFCHLWMSSPSDPRPTWPNAARRVISDPLPGRIPQEKTVLVCQPERAKRERLVNAAPLYRGDLIDPKTTRLVSRFGAPEG